MKPDTHASIANVFVLAVFDESWEGGEGAELEDIAIYRQIYNLRGACDIRSRFYGSIVICIITKGDKKNSKIYCERYPYRTCRIQSS